MNELDSLTIEIAKRLTSVGWMISAPDVNFEPERALRSRQLTELRTIISEVIANVVLDKRAERLAGTRNE